MRAYKRNTRRAKMSTIVVEGNCVTSLRRKGNIPIWSNRTLINWPAYIGRGINHRTTTRVGRKWFGEALYSQHHNTRAVHPHVPLLFKPKR